MFKIMQHLQHGHSSFFVVITLFGVGSNCASKMPFPCCKTHPASFPCQIAEELGQSFVAGPSSQLRPTLGTNHVVLGVFLGFPKSRILSLPELVDFKLFGKTILVVNTKFGLFLASQLGK